MSEDWGRNVALKIGIGGLLDYTPTRVGQTLHLPCSRGHTVDFHINKRMPPELVCKKLMHMGWTIGSKLVCPEHSSSSSKARCGTLAADPPPEPTPPEPAPPAPSPSHRLCRDGKVRFVPNTKLDYDPAFAARARAMTAKGASIPVIARELNISLSTLYRWRDRHPDFAAAWPTREETTMTATITPLPQPDPPPSSEAARTAKRLAIMALEEGFVDGRYKAGVSDETIAKMTGLSEAKVAAYREEFHGPIKKPAEIEEASAKLRQLQEELIAIERRFAGEVQAVRKRIDEQHNRLTATCARNKW